MDCGAVERDEWLRATWKVAVAWETDPEWLVFMDEMGANISLSRRLRVWSPGGQRAQGSVPR